MAGLVPSRALDRMAARIGDQFSADGTADLSAASLRPMSVDDFLDAIGVCAHLNYTDGRYQDLGHVLGSLRYLGIHHVRAAAPADKNMPAYRQISAHGIRLTMVVNGPRPIGSALSLLRQLEQHPGTIAAIEGPNELNNWPFAYAGLNGDAAGIAYQADLARKAHEIPLLRGIPIYNVTSWPDLAATADLGNVHAYPHNGEPPGRWLARAIAAQRRVMPDKPFVITETGYHDLVGKGAWEGVSGAAAASYMLMDLIDAIKLGAKRVFIYQLLDAYPDATMSDMDKHFGLFELSGRPKASAVAIHNLIKILGSFANVPTSGSNGSVSPAKVKAREPIARLDLTEGRTKILILHREIPLWDPRLHKQKKLSPISVTVTPPTGFHITAIYDPVAGSESLPMPADGRTISLGGEPMLLVFQPS